MAEEFLWGAATSAHQVEGDNVNNQWWDWERKARDRVRSGKATDHFNRFKADFGLAKSLGHNAHRLSIEWSRLEPAYNQWSRAAINHYREVLQDLRDKDIKSFVTLHHFTNPMWFENLGGWENVKASDLFARYVRVVVEELGDLIDFWVTINEPMVYASQSYWRGNWPPQKRSFWAMERVARGLAATHRKAYRVIHRARSQARVGIAKNFVAYLGGRWPAMIQDWWFNHRFFALTRGAHDFIGVNYYFAQTSKFERWNGVKSDMGWPVRPEGLEQVLEHVKRYGKPIYITENGLANEDDSKRADFIRGHLRVIEKAQEKGADVRGYFYWSLLDNFEWAHGFRPRFGLVEVDYKTFERKPRPSAYVYKAIIDKAMGRV